MEFLNFVRRAGMRLRRVSDSLPRASSRPGRWPQRATVIAITDKHQIAVDSITEAGAFDAGRLRAAPQYRGCSALVRL
jgi:hypothetical protein